MYNVFEIFLFFILFFYDFLTTTDLVTDPLVFETLSLKCSAVYRYSLIAPISWRFQLLLPNENHDHSQYCRPYLVDDP